MLAEFFNTLQFNTSLIIVTHDEELAARMDRQLRIEDGKLTQVIAEAS